MIRPSRFGPPVRPLPAWFVAGSLLCATACDDATPKGPENILIVTIDTLRSDVLGCYGNPDGHSPNIDALAAEGVLFENARSPVAVTFPSHSTIFTGVNPARHGVFWNAQSLDENWTTLAERLTAAGYRSGAFVSYRAMVGRGGLGQGFERVSDPVVRKDLPFTRPGSEVNALALAWLDELAEPPSSPEADSSDRESAPFFLWVHYFEPHSPYPLTDYAREKLADYEGPLADGAVLEELAPLQGRWSEAPEERRALQALYEGRVRDADRLLGELLAGMRQRGLLDTTTVLLTGDHGQAIGEHERWGHGAVTWEETLRVPLILTSPRIERPARIATDVGVVDVTPTVLEALDLPLADTLDGRSLWPVISGAELLPRPYFAEGHRIRSKEDLAGEYTPAEIAVYGPRRKLRLREAGAVVFDLGADPGETRELEPSGEIDQELLELAERHRLTGSRTEGGQPLMEEAVEAELRALGYMDSGEQ